MSKKYNPFNPYIIKSAVVILFLTGFLPVFAIQSGQEDTHSSLQESTQGIPGINADGYRENITLIESHEYETGRQDNAAIPTSRPSTVSTCIPRTRMENARVTGVTDGDTIRVRIEGIEYRVRYIGIDTPETDTGVLAASATSFNASLVMGKKVTLYRDVSDTDRFGRLLRYVAVDGIFVNYELVRGGYALASTYPPDVACADTFSNAQRAARQDATGLWRDVNSAVGLVYFGSSSGTTSVQCDPSYPGVCIPPSPPDLDCAQITYRRFKVLGSDPHRFDVNDNGIGCEL